MCVFICIVMGVGGVVELNYTFNDADGDYTATHAEDLAGHHNGTVVNAIHSGGYIGQSYKFDGTTDYINTTIKSMPTEFTISFWFKRIAGGNKMFTAKWEGGLGSFRIQDNNNLITPVIVDVNGDAGSCNYNVPQLDWVHTVMTFNGTNATLYINGSSACTTGLSNTFNWSAGGHVLIGAWQGGELSFNGYIDEYFILNTSMTSAQVTALYNGQVRNFTKGLYDCASVGSESLLIRIYNESDSSALNVDLEGYFNYTINGTSTRGILSFNSSTVNSKDICINTETDNVTADFHLYYTLSGNGYSYFGDDVFYNATAKTLNLYVCDNTDVVQFTILDNTGSGVSGAYMTIEKYHVGTNSYKTVEVVQTDTNGLTAARIILTTAWYRISIKYDGDTKLVDYPTRFFTTSRTYSIDLLGGDWYDNYMEYKDIAYTFNFTNATKKFSLFYDDSQQSAEHICLKVMQLNISGNKVLTDSCLDTDTGTILSTLSNWENNTYIGIAYANFTDGTQYIFDVIEESFTTDWAFYDAEDNMGVFVTIMLVMVLILVGVWSPFAAILFGLLGMILAVVAGFYYMSFSMLTVLIIMGGVVMYRVNRAR